MKYNPSLITLTIVNVIIIAVNITLYSIFPFTGMLVIFSIASLIPVTICVMGWIFKPYGDKSSH